MSKMRKVEEAKAQASLWRRLADSLAEMETWNPPQWEPPADMERRRLAGLERFKRKNPDYKEFPEEVQSEPQQLEGIRNRNSSGGKSTPKLNNNENRWSLQTTLELLDEMKAFVRSRKVSRVGTLNRTWKLIASKLSNPCGMELEKYARSCQVKFENIRRYLNGDKYKSGRLEVEVRDSVAHFDEICALFAAPEKSLNAPCTRGTDKIETILKVSSSEREEDTLDCSCPSVDAAAPQPTECRQRPAEGKEKVSLSFPSVVSERDSDEQGLFISRDVILRARRQREGGPATPSPVSRARLASLGGSRNKGTATSARSEKNVVQQNTDEQGPFISSDVILQAGRGGVGEPGTPFPVTRARLASMGGSRNKGTVTSARSEKIVVQQNADEQQGPLITRGVIPRAGRRRVGGSSSPYPVTRARLASIGGSRNKGTVTSAHSEKIVVQQGADRNDCVVRKSGLGRVESPATRSPAKKARPMRGCRTQMALSPATNA